MSLPELTVCLTTCGRPWYSVITLGALLHRVNYAGKKRFHIANGVTGNEEELDHCREILQGQDYTISQTDNLSAMLNACAADAGDMWLVCLDDFVPSAFDITPDVSFVLQNPDVGAIRMGRLAFWEHAEGETIYAHLRMYSSMHWWVFDHKVTNHPYIAAINACLYHRRYWDFYGDVPDVRPDCPGDAEMELARLFNYNIEGPTVAVPMRFGQNGQNFTEPFWQLPSWRTDKYAAAGGGRRM